MASIHGFIEMGRLAAMDGGGVMVGRIASRLIPDQVGISNSIAAGSLGSSTATIALAAAQIASGMLVAYAASRLIAGNTGNRLAAAIGAGTFDGVYEDILQGLSLPVVGQYLGDGASQLPMLAKATMGGYSIGGYSKTRALPRVSGYSATDGAAGQADAQRRRGFAGMAGGVIRSPY